MTCQEFSDEFDVLYNNITSNQAPGLDEYEKSVFLTKAKDEIIKAYFNAKLNKVQDGFDSTELRQINFSTLLKHKKLIAFEDSTLGYYNNSVSVNIGDDVLMIISEYIRVNRKNRGFVKLAVIPINYFMLLKNNSKPYRYPIHTQAWRIFHGTNDNHEAELIIGPNDEIMDYTIRYIKKPKPIIVVDLGDNLSIDGIHEKTECDDVDSSLHKEILQRAVELAKADYIGSIEHNLALGSNSETNMGIITPRSSGRND